jgi:hypothetical protein
VRALVSVLSPISPVPAFMRHARFSLNDAKRFNPSYAQRQDLLQGILLITSCLLLTNLDASRVYHWIRVQAAIKLYVIYNMLEVGFAGSFRRDYAD